MKIQAKKDQRGKSKAQAKKTQRRAARLRLVPVATPDEERQQRISCLRDLIRWLASLYPGQCGRNKPSRR